MLEIRMIRYNDYLKKFKVKIRSDFNIWDSDSYDYLFDEFFLKSHGDGYELSRHNEYQAYLSYYKGVDCSGIKICSDGVHVAENDNNVYLIFELRMCIKCGLLAIYANLHNEIFYLFDEYFDEQFIDFASNSSKNFIVYADVADGLDWLEDSLECIENPNLLGIKIENVQLYGIDNMFEFLMNYNYSTIDFYDEIAREVSELDGKVTNTLVALNDISYVGGYIELDCLSHIVAGFTNSQASFYSVSEHSIYGEKYNDIVKLMRSYKYSFLSSFAEYKYVKIDNNILDRCYEKYPFISIFGETDCGLSYIGKMYAFKYPNLTNIIYDFIKEYRNNTKYTKFQIFVFKDSEEDLYSNSRKVGLLSRVWFYIFVDTSKMLMDIGNGKDLLCLSRFYNKIVRTI